ncbi:MAG TPA: hypothetical protein VM869_34145 [Enhygromyxa sp.]|nr:hypothetical protein [Enhygromyxa sp.]
MTRHSTLLLATLLLGITACDKAEPAADQKQAKADANAKPDTAKADEAKPDEAKPDEAKPAELEKRTVASGLDLDMRFAAFEIINCDSGDKYCQVCKYGPTPKIMAVGTIDDAGFKQDLKDLDALVKKYGDDKVKAFAVIADARDGALVTPIGNKDTLQAQAKALKEELGLSFPVVLPAPEGEAPNGVFEDHYQIKQSRTIMFADGKNQVKYSEVAPADKNGLDAAIKAVVG